MKLKGAIFDMDGTLVNSLMFWDMTWEKVGLKYFGKKGFHPGSEVAKTVQTMIIKDAAAYIIDLCKINTDVKEFQDYIGYLLGEFYKTVAKPKDGALEFLDHMQKLNVKMCLASATPKEYIMVSLEACGLSKYFDTVLSCVDIGAGKDKPDIYVTALELLGTKPEETAVFEDSYVALRTAKSIGVHTVGIYDKYNSNPYLEGISEIYLPEGKDMTSLIDLFD